MKPTGPLLILGSLALWAALLAAPTQGSAGSSLLSQMDGAGENWQRETPSVGEGRTFLLVVKKVADMLQEAPMPGENPAPQKQPGSKEAEIITFEKISQPEGTPVKSAEQLQAGIERKRLLDKNLGLGLAIVSDGKEVLSVVGSSAVDKTILCNIGPAAHEGFMPGKKLTSGEEPQTGVKPVSNTKLAPSKSPASNETEGPCTGQTMRNKSLCSGKPASSGKPSSMTHTAQGSPAADEKPTSGDKPTPGEKPPSSVKPAPLDKEKPAAEKPQAEEEPEQDAGGDSEENSPEEENSDDDDEEEEDEDEGRYEGVDSIFSDDSKAGSEDSFDHELDYGLQNSPFNSDEYHDWWGGGDDMELDAEPEGDEGGLGEETGGDAHEEPVFDVWGDLVEKGIKPEARSNKPVAETA